MVYTVRQVAALSGVSVRTLHYYHEIGLLVPASQTDAGYRLYDDDNLEQLQQILFFRELGFALKDIGSIICHPDFDRRSALKKHRHLLMMERRRLTGLITLIDKTIEGESHMSFQEFDTTAIEKAKQEYAREARDRWGHTEAYAQSEAKTSSYGKQDWSDIQQQADAIYAELASGMNRQLPPDHPDVQQLVADWQAHITRYFYPCTNEILAGLGVMYVEDDRFHAYFDKIAPGLAEYISHAIAVFTA